MFDLQVQMNGASWKASLDLFNDFLNSRRSNGSSCLLLGTTDCIYKSVDSFVNIINYFAPCSDKHVTYRRNTGKYKMQTDCLVIIYY